jgi:hypothetical protein
MQLFSRGVIKSHSDQIASLNYVNYFPIGIALDGLADGTPTAAQSAWTCLLLCHG